MFKVVDNNLTTIFNKTQNISNGFSAASDSVSRFVDGFNRLNTQQNFGSRWDSFINGATSANGNMAAYFEDLAKQGASARASVEGVYAAILDGNTRGIGNVKSVIATFNSLNPANQKAFATAVGQTNIQLGSYLTNLNGSSASLKGYASQLAVSTAKTVALNAASIALNMTLTTGILWLINKGIQVWQEYHQSQEELRKKALEDASALKEQADAMKDLVSQYEAILDSEKTEAEKTEELNEWKQTLADTYGFEKDKLRELNLEREEGIELLKQEIKASDRNNRDEWLGENVKQIDKAIAKIDKAVNIGGFSLDFSSVDKKIKDYFTADVGGQYKLNGDNLIEEYESLQKVIGYLGSKNELTDTEGQLLDELNRQKTKAEKILSDYREIYETYFDFKSQNLFEDYAVDNNAIENVTKDTYQAWKNGLLKSANGDTQLEKELTEIVNTQLPDLTQYFENLATAKEKFLSNIKINSQADIEAKKSYEKFIDGLNSDELNILLGLDDTVFNQGIDGVKKIIADIQTDPNYVIEVQIAIDEEKLENLRNSIKEITDSQKDLTSAIDEQKEHGQLSASTIQSLTEAGYAEALVIDKVTGAVTLNTTAYEKLINEKKKEIQLEIARLKVDLINPYKDETAAIADLERSLSTLNATEREATQIKIANMKAQLANSKLTDEQIRQKEQQLADLEAMLASLDAPTFDDSSSSSSGSDDDTPESVKNFETELAKRQHEIATGKRKENADYYDWLLSAARKAYDGLADYEEELWKYEEQVYEWRKDHEQDLFDQKIENLDKEKEKALENNDFSTAKTSVNTQITETKKRIVELKTSGKQDVDWNELSHTRDFSHE